MLYSGVTSILFFLLSLSLHHGAFSLSRSQNLVGERVGLEISHVKTLFDS